MKALKRPDNCSKDFKELVRRAVVNTNNKYSMDFDSIILWTLHEEFGFGEERLHRFYISVKSMVDNLNEWYEMPKENGFICRLKLKQIGIDLEKWQDDILKR